MKNTHKMIMILLLLIGSSAMEAHSTTVIKTVIGRVRDCKGLGVCSVIVEKDPAPLLAGEVKAVADLDGDNRLVLTFSKSKDMLPETFTNYFSKGIFVCDDDYQVPPEILKALNYFRPYTIRSGNYPVEIKGDLITLVL